MTKGERKWGRMQVLEKNCLYSSHLFEICISSDLKNSVSSVLKWVRAGTVRFKFERSNELEQIDGLDGTY
jgi:hypothetical protein